MVSGSRHIYVKLISDDGNMFTKNPVSMHIQMPLNDPAAEWQAAADAAQVSIDLWHQTLNNAALGHAIGRKSRHTFGFYARQLIHQYHKEAMVYGILPRGELRDELWGDLTVFKAPAERKYTNTRGGNRHRVNREALAERRQKLLADAIANHKRPDKGKKWVRKADEVRLVTRRWGNVPLTAMTDDALNEWARGLRMDRGPRKGQPFTKGRLAAFSNAISAVWRVAVKAGAVSSTRKRPAIKWSELGDDNAEPAYFSDQEIELLARHISEQWDTASFEQRLEFLYPATIICTGIRPGMELLATRIGQFVTEPLLDRNYDPPVKRPGYFIDVVRNAGKYPEPRRVNVYLGPDLYFPIIKMMQDVIEEWRRILPKDQFLRSGLFGPERLDFGEHYRETTQAIFKELGILFDANDKRRTPYSLRSFFATTMIRKNEISLPDLADWMGTSVRMLLEHYYKAITAAQGYKRDGWRKPD
jgi:integrase